MVGLLVVLVAAIGVPRLLEREERAKACEAFEFLESVREAQLQYRQSTGRFADTVSKLDTAKNSPAYFACQPIEAMGDQTLAESWTLTLIRSGGRKTGYGAYTITYTNDGFDHAQSTVDRTILP